MPRERSREWNGQPGEASAGVRARVETAATRLREDAPAFGVAADELLSRAVDRLPLSARGRTRVARTAVTIAALAAAAAVEPEHVAEALSYRAPTELDARR
ncbi:MAG: hypothetical protein M3303_08805 [Gemmatimonadota bacterium]|nr:hypothetical protein [Gemmatimonadota bacterium]